MENPVYEPNFRNFRIGFSRGFSRGFSLVELIVILAVLTILIGVAIPSLSAYNRSSFEIERRNQEELVNMAIRQYYAYEGHYPDPTTSTPIGDFLNYEQKVKLQELLSSVTSVKIDIVKYDFAYDKGTGQCTIISAKS